MSYATQHQGTERNRLYPVDRPVHAWYRFPLSFPPHLVRQYTDRFNLTPQSHVLDPLNGHHAGGVQKTRHPQHGY